MTVFLAGGGDPAHSVAIDEAFGRAVGGGRVVYLPTALIGTSLFKDADRWFRSTFAPFGIDSVETWTDLADRRLADVPDLAGLAIGGGNTYRLVHELRATGLLDEIGAAIRSGLNVYGGSAGAIVLGADIATADLGGDERLDGQRDMTGADVLAGWSVACHYDASHDALLDRWFTDDPSRRAIAIPEAAGVVIEEGRARSVGAAVRLRTTESDTLLQPGTLQRL